MSNPELTQAFILHARAFKETSLIVEAFTLSDGRVSLVSKGARSAGKKNNKRAMLQPFNPILLNWLGRSNLRTLKQLDSNGLPYKLQGLNNLCGLYLNELLLRLLTQWDPHPELFQIYQQTIELIQNSNEPHVLLREFELYLLDELGYAIDWNSDIQGDNFEPNELYSYVPLQGFNLDTLKQSGSLLIKGELIQAVANKNWQYKGSLSLARRICRHIIDHLLDGRALNSRKLLQQTLALQAQD